MERIASFQVDHNKLLPGMYLSRRDGEVVTFDLRFKKPNTGDLLGRTHYCHPAPERTGQGCRHLLRPHGLSDGLLLPL